MAAPLFEICVEGIDGLIAAEAGGADRVELCAALVEGGITPSIGVVKEALKRATRPFHPIVRPRGGDFLYSAAEFAGMLDDVAELRRLGVAGVVFGCLTAEGDVDEDRMRLLVQRARPMHVTCHRAFDMARDPGAALEALIRAGVDRVLTSGQRPSAFDGLPLLRRLFEQAGERIIIMGCGQLRPETIGPFCRALQLKELHFSAPKEEPSRMQFKNPGLSMGGLPLEREYWHTVTDSERVFQTIAAARAAAGLVAAQAAK